MVLQGFVDAFAGRSRNLLFQVVQGAHKGLDHVVGIAKPARFFYKGWGGAFRWHRGVRAAAYIRMRTHARMFKLVGDAREHCACVHTCACAYFVCVCVLFLCCFCASRQDNDGALRQCVHSFAASMCACTDMTCVFMINGCLCGL